MTEKLNANLHKVYPGSGWRVLDNITLEWDRSLSDDFDQLVSDIRVPIDMSFGPEHIFANEGVIRDIQINGVILDDQA